jgi:pimeloyl-ACP methyl ester carboxylesterase
MKETTLLFGTGNGLIGTIARPERTPPAAIGVILLNAGIIHRVGPHRINVRLARELARQGIASIRFDLAGHGDSARPSGERSFADQAVADVRDAADALGAAAGLRHFAVFGICSGAHHAFQAALRDERLTALILYDAFFYPTLKTRLLHYLKGLREPHLLHRSVRFCARRLGLQRSNSRTGTPPPKPAGEMARLGVIEVVPTKELVGAGLQTLIQRGVTIYAIYSGTNLREYNYAGQFHDMFLKYGAADSVQVAFRPDLDHQFSVIQGQRDMIRELVEWTGRLGLPDARAAQA